MFKKNKSKSISERVSEAFINKLSESECDSEAESAAKIEYLDEEDYDFKKDAACQPSEIRKQNSQILSKHSSKYRGEVSSRRDLNSSDDESESMDEDISNTDNQQQDDSESMDEDSDDQQQDNSSISGDSIGDGSSVEKNDESAEEDLVLTKSHKLQVEKGLCVQNQLDIWEKLLEIRIHSQKLMNTTNSLPSPDEFTKLSSQKEFSGTAQQTKQNVEVLLDKLLETREMLANGFSEIKKLKMTTKRSSLKSSNKFDHLISSNFKIFKPYRNSVLLKWEDRTKMLTSSGASKKKGLREEGDIIKKIDNFLIKKDDHVNKSQTIKGNYVLFGQNGSNVKNDPSKEVISPQVYDDTDFYHSQLRELIEFKSNMSSNAYDVASQFTELQKLRQKMKKKVDTRASKGRKIRYVVHHKLINFMAPKDTTEWTEESKNELYKSLFIH